MSRSYKDRPWKLRFPESQWDYAYERIPYQKWSNEFQYLYNFWCYIEKPGVKTKKKRSYVEYHGMPTPSWWTRLCMNQPQRARGRQWERQIVKCNLDELIDSEPPGVGKKPHIYYW